jgi:moderate conductance mechanosensitive channel
MLRQRYEPDQMTSHPRGGFQVLLSVLALVIGAQLGAATPLRADEPVTIILKGDEKPEVITRTIEALTQNGKAVTVRIAPAKKGADSPADDANSVLDRAGVFWDYFVSALHVGNADLPKVGLLPGDLARGWSANSNGVEGLPAIMRVVLALTLAALAAFLVRALARPFLAARCVPESPLLVHRFKAALAVGLRDLLTLAAFWLAARLGANLLLPQVDLAARTVNIAVIATLYAAAYLIVGRFFLAPNAPERRLLPLPRAEHHFRLLTIFALSANFLLAVAAIAGPAASDKGSVTGLFALLALPVVLYKLWWFWDLRHDMTTLVLGEPVEGREPHKVRQFLAHAAPWFYMVTAILIWMVVRAATVLPNGFRWAIAASYTQILLFMIPLVAVGLTALVRSLRALRAESAKPTPVHGAFGQTLESGIGALAWAGGLSLMAQIWGSLLVDVNSSEYAATMRHVMVIATVTFSGWVLLTFLRGYFDAYAIDKPTTGPVDEDAEVQDSVPSRLGTVLPVLRGIVLGAVIAFTGLIVISRLGIDIAPLLAGFGILGLAVSFGSQALVRDIVSGFFFMLEDAFRIGEYVDTGRLKGTVEKISLRSMQLRHQSGQIHTVPFGQIPSLTNASRDWATIKFNLRLDRSVDIEKARKAIKKVGVAMMDDPEIAPHLIEPLKMQGVADIADNAIVVRLKFTAKPAHASTVQRNAMKMVYQALNEAGIPFASNAVTVNSAEDRMGAAAALTRAPVAIPAAPSG